MNGPKFGGQVSIALGSAAVIIALQMIDAADYETSVTAYGIVTRMLTFMFLPLLGLTHAVQTIVGNNYGARAWQRSDQSLRIGMAIAFIYCVTAQILLMIYPEAIAGAFVSDPDVTAKFAYITRLSVLMLWLAGPLIVIATYFQAIGNAPRAAILGLTKPYAFALPLTFGLPLVWGENGIWLAGPVAEMLMAGLTLAVLRQTKGALNLRQGLFTAPA